MFFENRVFVSGHIVSELVNLASCMLSAILSALVRAHILIGLHDMSSIVEEVCVVIVEICVFIGRRTRLML